MTGVQTCALPILMDEVEIDNLDDLLDLGDIDDLGDDSIDSVQVDIDE